MSHILFDTDELGQLERELVEASISHKNGRYLKQFMRNSGNKLNRRIKASLRQSDITSRSGNLMKGIKRGKVYKSRVNDDAWSIRVYGGSPAWHTHLLEYGHYMVLWGTPTNPKRYTRAFGYFDKGSKNYESEFIGDVEDYVDKLLFEVGLY